MRSNGENVAGSGGPEWIARSASASSTTRVRSSSAGTGRASMKPVTRQPRRGSNATTSGPMPSAAAAAVAARSASRSIPSSSVFLPGSRTTQSRPPNRTR